MQSSRPCAPRCDDDAALAEDETLPTAIGGRRVSRAAARRRSIRLAVFLQEHFHLARAFRDRAPRFDARRSCEDFSPWSLGAQAARLANHRVRTAAGDARARDPRCLYMNGTHWNPDGQALAANALASVLLPLIPPARTLAGAR